MSDNDFAGLGMGPGVKPHGSGGDISHLLPENQPHGKSAVYDRAIAAGATHEQAEEAVRVHVYGVGYPRDRKGNPIERGIGSDLNPSGNHFAAIRRWEGEHAYQAALKKIWRDSPDKARQLGLPEPTRASA
jgi:hypothetical protein